MHALVIHAHPDPDGYTTRLRDAAIAGLRGAGHTATLVDLYGEGFRPAMSGPERRAYEADPGALEPDVAHHAELLRHAEALVFVFPTWSTGLPAMLKGWLERVFVPGVAFHLDGRTNQVRSDLRTVRRLVGITTDASSTWHTRLLGDTGRWTVMRTCRLMASWRCRRTWMAIDRVDRRTPGELSAFAADVERRMAKL